MEHQRDFARRNFRDLSRKSELLAGRISAFRSRLVPATFYWLLGILGGLLVAGVIAPLFFLSAEDGLSKPLLIGLFIPLSVSFLAYTSYELLKLRGAVRLDREKF